MKNIREIFGVDYLLSKKPERPYADTSKLSDLVKWQPDALKLTDTVIERIRVKVCEMAKEVAYKNNRALVHRGDVFGVLQELNLYYYDSED